MSYTKNISYIQFGTLTGEEWLQYSAAEINKPSLKGSPDKDRHGTPYDKRLGILENTKDPCLTCNLINMKCDGHFGHIVLPFPIYNKVFTSFTIHILKSFCTECARPRILPRHAEMQGFLKESGPECLRKFSKKSEKVSFCPWEGECEKTFYECKKCCKKCDHLSKIRKGNAYIACKECGGCKRCRSICKKCVKCKDKSECKGCRHCIDCKSCASPLSSFTYRDGEIYQQFEKGELVLFTAGEAYNVFIRIKNEHLPLLGFNRNLSVLPITYKIGNKTHPHQFRPESMIWTVFPVLPPRARPYVIRDGEKHDDDITDLLNSIIKCCNKLEIDGEGQSVPHSRSRRKTALSITEKAKVSENLRKFVWSVIDNSEQSSKLSSGGRAHKCLFTRTQGKKGRIQLNVGAKRSDFTARSVIVGGGLDLEEGQLGVPQYIAEEETKPEKVKDWNIAHLQELVDTEKVNRVIRNGEVIRLKDHNKYRLLELQIDDIVERQLRDGDRVGFNRQPTLRLESFISFKAKIIPDIYAFRLDLSRTTGFNADFDGDEMNLHVVQSTKASAEMSILMRSSVNIMTPQTNSPIAGIVQDGLTGAYILTNTWEENENGEKHTFVEKDTFMDTLLGANIKIEAYQDMLKRAYVYYPDYIFIDDNNNEEDNVYTIADRVPGKLLISILFPRNFCYERTLEIDKGINVTISITDGIMHIDSGPLFKKIIGGKASSIIHQIWKDYSPEVASHFLTNTERLIDIWFPSHGFSIGVSDFISSSNELVTKELAQLNGKVTSMLTKGYSSKIESNINNELNSAMNIGPRIAKTSMNKGERNSLNIMRLSMAKGSTINSSSITAFVGGQNIDAGRIPLYLANGTKSLPTFESGDNSAAARGFVFNSYMDGLTPEETVFHAMAGREGIISTAVKTSESGYIQKKVSKKLEDYKYMIDGTVRDANGRIMQFLYGDDGMDPSKLCYTKGSEYPFFVNPMNIANRFNSDVRLSNRDKNNKIRKLEESEIELLLSFIVAGSPGIQTPVTKLCTKNIRSVLRNTLTSLIIYESEIPEFCAEIRNIYESSKSQYGDMVGLIASLSIGEPTTQMTLNVFHLAGCGEKDVSQGVPRFKEIMNATSDPKKPTCTVYFKSEFIINNTEKILKIEKKIKSKRKKKTERCDEQVIKLEKKSKLLKKECLEHIQGRKKEFEYTTVQTFFIDYEMRYLSEDVDSIKGVSPLNILTYNEYSPEWWVTLSKKLNDELTDITPESWVLILSFDLKKMYEKKITLDDIAQAIELYSDKNLKCIVSPTCIGKIEVYLNYSDIKEYVIGKLNVDQDDDNERILITEDNVNYFTCREVALKLAISAPISGIYGISKTFAREDALTKEWILDTRGSNFLEILSMDEVDPYKTISDDMWEIYNVLGIEAARLFLIEELTRIIGFDGTYVNVRHIQILVDSMTISGSITSVRRDGISRDVGPIAKIMFEKSVANGVTASVFTENDMIDSVSASVMYGKQAKCGTGLVNVKSIDKIPTKKVTFADDEEIEEVLINIKPSKGPKKRVRKAKINKK